MAINFLRVYGPNSKGGVALYTCTIRRHGEEGGKGKKKNVISSH